jgi:hypothetical protein
VDTEEWVQLARSLGERRFLAKHRGLFLLTTSGTDELSSLYNTSSSVTSGRLRRRTVGVRFIHPAEDSADPSRITVGRSGGNDVPFTHPSVSKHHACFYQQGGKLMLTDLGSRNGTCINGARLTPDLPSPVEVRDRISFGDVQALVLDARELFEVLGQM